MNISIIGVMGYSGIELYKLLNKHPRVNIVSVHGTQNIGQSIERLFPGIPTEETIVIEEVDAEMIMNQADLVFFATPSGISSKEAQPFIEANFPVIDLSGDYRLSKEIYEKWYPHQSAEKGQNQAVYGLAEFSDSYQKTLIANPGCYATATLLGLAPLANAHLIKETPIIDAKSGLTGAGKSLSASSHFVGVNENMSMYKINKHQHIPEIMNQLRQWQEDSPPIQFQTSLIPISRGIFTSIYLKIDRKFEDIYQLYQMMYESKVFVQLKPMGLMPNLKDVIGSNFTAIGLAYNEATQILTIVSVLDNLIKGAAGQAVQNLNLFMGISETTGLEATPQLI